MKSTLASCVAAAVLLASGAVAQSGPQINTPLNPPQCLPLLIQWSGGTPPYFIRLIFFSLQVDAFSYFLCSIHPGAEPTAPALVDFGQQDGNQLTWVVNFEANTQLDLTIRDSTGATNQSAVFTVQASTERGCLDQPASQSSGGSAPPAPGPSDVPGPSAPSAPSSPPPGPSAPPPPAPSSSAPSPRPSAPSGSSPSGSKPPATGSPSPTPSNNSATSSQVGFAGIVGALLLTCLA